VMSGETATPVWAVRARWRAGLLLLSWVALACGDRSGAAVHGVEAGVSERAEPPFSPRFFVTALALTLTYLGNQLQAPVQGVLVAMIFRMGLPLAAIIVLPKLGGPLGAGGVTTTIVGVYLIALIVETGLSLRMIQPQSRMARAA